VIGYKQTLLLASLYDPGSGLVLWALDGAPKIPPGKTPLLAVASDYQESKNIDQAGNVLPNSSFRSLQLRAVKRPTTSDQSAGLASMRRPGSPQWCSRPPRTPRSRHSGCVSLSGAWEKVRDRLGGSRRFSDVSADWAWPVACNLFHSWSRARVTRPPQSSTFAT